MANLPNRMHDERDLQALRARCSGKSIADVAAETGSTSGQISKIITRIRTEDICHCATWGDKPKDVAMFWAQNLPYKCAVQKRG